MERDLLIILCAFSFVNRVSTMNIFFDLPEVHQRIILSRWLSIDQLTVFDSALCNRKCRQEYLAIIRSPACTFTSFGSSHATLADQWVAKRRLRFIELVFSGTADPHWRGEVLKLSAGTVQSMTILTFSALVDSNYKEATEPTEHDTDECLVGFLGLIGSYCTELRELAVLGSNRYETGSAFQLTTWDPLVHILQANGSLWSLHIGGGGNIDLRVLSAMFQAPVLAELHLTHCTFSAPFSELPRDEVSPSVTTLEYSGGTAVAGLCQHLPYLTALRGGVLHTHKDANSLFNCCAHMSSVELSCDVLLTDHICLAMTRNWQELTQLTLQLTNIDLSACSEEALLQIIHHCPLLQYINVCNVGCDSVVMPFEDERLDASGEGWDEIRAEKRDLRSDITEPGSHLQVLRVDCLSECGLRAIVGMCKHLHKLAILHACEIEGPMEHIEQERLQPAERALQHLNNSSVKTLHLQNYISLCDVDLDQLSDLDELCIARVSDGLTSAGIVRLASRCPALKVLCVVDALSVTHECLGVLGLCPELSIFEYHASEPTRERDDPEMSMLKEALCSNYPNLDRLELHF